MREEGLALIPAVEEAIEIGRAAGLPVVLTHHKVVGQPSWGASVKTLALVDSARARGQDVMIDQYPYTASYTGISILIPSWALAGGPETLKTVLIMSSTSSRYVLYEPLGWSEQQVRSLLMEQLQKKMAMIGVAMPPDIAAIYTGGTPLRSVG